MARTQKTAPLAPLAVRVIPCPSTGARPRGFKAAAIEPARRPDDNEAITIHAWLSPEGAIAVQYTTTYRENQPTREHRYVVSTIVNGRAWIITNNTRSASGRLAYHTASTIKALAGAIAARVAADPSPWQALQTAPTTGRNNVPAASAVDAFHKQIADLIAV